MAWDEAQEEYWAEVEKALRELHGVTTYFADEDETTQLPVVIEERTEEDDE